MLTSQPFRLHCLSTFVTLESETVAEEQSVTPIAFFFSTLDLEEEEAEGIDEEKYRRSWSRRIIVVMIFLSG